MNPIRLGARKLALYAAVPLALLGSGAFVWQASYAAFIGTTSTASNPFTTGSVTLTSGPASATFSNITNLVPHASLNTMTVPATGALSASGSGGSACVLVEYTGNVAADVRLHATITENADSGAAPHVNTTLADKLLFSVDIANWTNEAAAIDCSTYPTSGSYIFGSAANNSVYLTSFPDGGWSDGTINTTHWQNVSNGAKKFYRFSWMLPAGTGTNDPQAEQVNVTFTWEARNV